MSRAIEGGRLFHGDGDRKRYMALLQMVVDRHQWSVLAFALMDTHVHLLVNTTTRRLSAGLWWLNWNYAEYYKRVRGPRFGHVFGDRPKSKPIRDDRYFLAVARYIALNPVGVYCVEPVDYHWSSHRVIVGKGAPLPMIARDELLAWFGPHGAVARYQEFVAGVDPVHHRAVRRWAARPPEHRPPLEALVADGDPASLLAAHETWEYSIRAIATATSQGYSKVRRAIIEAGESRGLSP